jgi:hypothetical protein
MSEAQIFRKITPLESRFIWHIFCLILFMSHTVLARSSLLRSKK